MDVINEELNFRELIEEIRRTISLWKELMK
jgi:hypothetical protein